MEQSIHTLKEREKAREIETDRERDRERQRVWERERMKKKGKEVHERIKSSSEQMPLDAFLKKYFEQMSNGIQAQKHITSGHVDKLNTITYFKSEEKDVVISTKTKKIKPINNEEIIFLQSCGLKNSKIKCFQNCSNLAVESTQT